LRSIVLLIDDSDLSRIVYHSLAEEFHIEAVVREMRVPRVTFLKRRLKRFGWRILLGQIIFAKCIVPLLRLESLRRRADILRQWRLDCTPITAHKIIDVSSINSDQVVMLLQQKSPRVVIVNGTRILEEKLLKATSSVILNTHIGITPLYRGVHGGYWALASGDPHNFGVTVHKIDSGIDTGEIVASVIITPAKSDNFVTYPLLQIARAIPLLKQAIRDAINGSSHVFPPPIGTSRLWSHPTATEYLRNRFVFNIR